jgi:DNA-binding beta-propeller fold protein YncE
MIINPLKSFKLYPKTGPIDIIILIRFLALYLKSDKTCLQDILTIQILQLKISNIKYFTGRVLRAIIIFFLPVITIYTARAQDTNTGTSGEDHIIEWVSQYPAAQGEATDRKFRDRFVEFLTGKNERVIMSKPVAVCAMSPDTFLILDQENGTMFRVENGLGDITHFKKGNYKYFPSLVSIISLPGDSIIFTDSYLNKIFVTVTGSKEAKSLNDSLKLEQPTGIAWSRATNQFWVAETKAHRVSILDRNGQLVKQLGGRGDGPGEFNFPTSIWIDDSGRAYIIDAMNFRVQVFSADGNFINVFGNAGDATGYFARPRGIATDSQGNIYITDALFNAVQIFDISGNFLYSFGKQGREKGEFWMPAGISIDQKDNIYVADSYNARIQVFHLTKAKLNEKN